MTSSMNNSGTSLDQLHDIVVPEPIPWWPPTTAWYVVFAVAFLLLLVIVWLWGKRWRANAYRRAALRELADAQSATAVSELLRRVALSIAPRSVVAAQLGTSWPNWLAERYPQPMPSEVRAQLETGVYGAEASNADLNKLKAYAARWIAGHRVPHDSDH